MAMHKNKHLTRELLTDIIYGRKKRDAHPHIADCDICNEALTIVEASFEIAKKPTIGGKDSPPDDFDISKNITQIYDNSISKENAGKLFNALVSSDRFFQQLVVMLEESLAPVENGSLLNNDISFAEMVLKARPPIQSFLQKMIDFLKKTGDWITEKRPSIPMQAPRLVGLTALMVIIFVGHNFYTDWNQRKIFMAHFTYKEQVPLPYTKSGFKGAEVISEVSRLDFLFKQAIADYLLTNYQGSIAAFSNMETEADRLTNNTANAELLLDYYLYYSLSHLALFTSEKTITDLEEEEHVTLAITMLFKAKSYTGRVDNTSQTIDYFLGVAYWFSDKKEEALVNLKNVFGSNQFYDNAQLLIGKIESGE